MIPERKRKRKGIEGVDGSENERTEKMPQKDHVSSEKKKKKEQEIDVCGKTELPHKKTKEINPTYGKTFVFLLKKQRERKK